MKISKGVTYHAFDDKVFGHTATNKNLILDGNALEIFDYVAENPDCTIKELGDFLSLSMKRMTQKKLEMPLVNLLTKCLKKISSAKQMIQRRFCIRLWKTFQIILSRLNNYF